MKINGCYTLFNKYVNYLKNILCVVFMGVMLSITGFGLAESINKVSLESLQNIKGVGKNKAQKIIAERQRGGDFQNAADLRQRVKGVGEKTVLKMEQAGISFTDEIHPDTQSSSPSISSAPERKLRSRSRSQ
jgi:competence protein ComEA